MDGRCQSAASAHHFPEQEPHLPRQADQVHQCCMTPSTMVLAYKCGQKKLNNLYYYKDAFLIRNPPTTELILTETVFYNPREQSVNRTSNFLFKIIFNLYNFLPSVYRCRVNAISDCHINKSFFQKAKTRWQS